MLDETLHCCLYFTAGKLCRAMNKFAEEEFQLVGLSPTYAFLLMIVNERKEISPTELSERLHITNSTTTRFLDKLESKKLIQRVFLGRNAVISSTPEGIALQPEIEKAWERLYHRYSKLLGYKEGAHLARVIDEAGRKLEND